MFCNLPPDWPTGEFLTNGGQPTKILTREVHYYFVTNMVTLCTVCLYPGAQNFFLIPEFQIAK